jgi:hypothetical protein
MGYPIHVPFDGTKHLAEDRFELASGTRAKNVMHWAISRGKKIYPNTKVTLDVYSEFRGIDYTKKLPVTQHLYQNGDEEPPERLDNDCKLMGTLRMDMTELVGAERKRLRKENNGRDRNNITIDLKMECSPGSEKGLLVRRAISGQRREIGKVALEFAADTIAVSKQRKR